MVFAGLFLYLYDTGKVDLVKTLLTTGTLPDNALRAVPLPTPGILTGANSAIGDLLKQIPGIGGGNGSGTIETPPIAGN